MRGEIDHIKYYKDVHRADFSPYKSKHIGGLVLQGADTVVNLKQPTRACKHTGGEIFSGCHRLIVADLEAQEGKIVGNSQLKEDDITIFCV